MKAGVGSLWRVGSLCDGASALSVITRALIQCSLTGNSNFTSLPVSFLYTVPNVSTLYSTLAASFGSRYTLMIFEPSSR